MCSVWAISGGQHVKRRFLPFYCPVAIKAEFVGGPYCGDVVSIMSIRPVLFRTGIENDRTLYVTSENPEHVRYEWDGKVYVYSPKHEHQTLA